MRCHHVCRPGDGGSCVTLVSRAPSPLLSPRGGALLLGRRRDRRGGDSRRLGLPALLDHACELLALLRQVMTPDAPGPFGPLQMLPRRHQERRFVALGHRARPATGSARGRLGLSRRWRGATERDECPAVGRGGGWDLLRALDQFYTESWPFKSALWRACRCSTISIARASCSCRTAFSGLPFRRRIAAHSRCCAGDIRKRPGGSSIMRRGLSVLTKEPPG